jgi:hypothetical protein
MENISFGQTYQSLYLSEEAKTRKTRVTKVTNKKYGYSIQMFNDYVTLYYIKLIINEDGSAKAHVRMEKNYQPTQRWTLYFAPDGREIKDATNSTRKELATYKKLRNA